MVDGKAIQDRPDYWQLVKFTVEKEAEINFDDAKKVSKLKAMTHFKFNRKKVSLPVNPTVWMVVPAPEEEVGAEEVTPLLIEYSNSGESYEASPDDTPVSTGDLKVAVRVTHASEAFSGRCFSCNKVGHHFQNEECEMYDPDFFKLKRGTCKGQPKLTGSWSKESTQIVWGQGKPVGNACINPDTSNPEDRDGETREEEVMTQKARIPPSSKRLSNPSPTDLPARKKHNAMPP